jgi:hypothetical protein
MCDYSLHHLMSRPAKVGDKLVSTNFVGTITRGFAAAGAPNVACCLMPGTEIAFAQDVSHYDDVTNLPTRNVGQRLARFRQINKDHPTTHHDALEFPDGQIVLLTRLCEGQHATVLQLPVSAQPANMQPAEAREEAAPAERTSEAQDFVFIRR